MVAIPSRRLLSVLIAFLPLAFVAGHAEAAPAAPSVYFVAAVDDDVSVTFDSEEVGTVSAASVSDPLRTRPGRHRVVFESPDWTASARITVDGPSTDIVVHRPADATDDPRVTVFANDVRPIAAGRAGLTIAHTAVVPPADVRADGEVLFANIANGEFVTAEVPVATYSVDIVPTGGSKPLFGPVELTPEAGALTRVFAIGRPQQGGMDVVVQVLPLRSTGSRPPTSVDAGEAGLVAPGRADGGADRSGPMAAAAIVSVLAVLLACAALRRRLRLGVR